MVMSKLLSESSLKQIEEQNPVAGKIFRKFAGARAGANSSDPAAVLDAGWKAMQTVDPRLAQAVAKMPPQIAQGAVMQYTNAIRMGKEAEASSMAIEAARAGLASLPATGQPAMNASSMRKMLGGAFGGQKRYEIGDIDSFNKAIAAPPADPYQTIGRGILGKLGKSMQPKTQDNTPLYQDVRNKYDAYEMSGYTDEEKMIDKSYGLGLDPAKRKNLNSYSGWSPSPLPGSQPSDGGLINNPFGSQSGGY